MIITYLIIIGISPIQPLSPQQPLISAQNSEEKLCGVLVFASKKCPSGKKLWTNFIILCEILI